MPSTQYNYPVSKIFGVGLLNALGDNEFENSVKSLLLESGILPQKRNCDFIEAVDLAYNHLKKNYRCEYVYKNEIANQLLLKLHKDNSATLLSEFNINSSIADIVIVNGATSVYEVKTELDNFDRLDTQIQDYTQVFDNVCVVTHAAALKQVKNLLPKHVGIVLLQANGKLVFDRNPIGNESQFNKEIAGRALRQTELVTAYTKHHGAFPNVGTAYIGTICREWFRGLDTTTAKQVFKDSLKGRKPSSTHFKLIKQSPHALKMILLSREVSKKTCKSIGDKLNIIL